MVCYSCCVEFLLCVWLLGLVFWLFELVGYLELNTIDILDWLSYL